MTSNLKHLLLSLLIISLTVQTVFGQRLNDEELQKKVTSTTGVLVGSIVNENGKYLEFATVYILRAADSLAIAYGITNAYGEFLIPDVPFGDFILKIDYIGYRPHYSSVSSISKSKPVLKLQKIKLDQSVTMLGSVEIKAQVEMLESNLDKKVFNVGSSIISEGATAVEVLEEIPSVDVDLEGNVTLRGSENVTILIDGRPTDMTLDQIPANLIESIEVITNPSARLEPDGMAGILNVVLKKRKQGGFNGMVSLRSSMYLFQNKPYFNNYNGNINLNYSYGNINVFLNYDFRSFGRNSAGTMERTSWIGDDSTWLYQDNYNDNIGYMHNVRTGIDWNINP
ncbi:MAG TPA: TonB-dependent receptor, partial [Bacteroidales bacterium]|nr:TonB-dependent receptor [Bacteroidales bacterium]